MQLCGDTSLTVFVVLSNFFFLAFWLLLDNTFNVRLSVNWGVVCPHFPVEPSPQTSTNVLWAVRNQEQDFCSQGLSLVQDQESEGSDTSSCPDSDVTVDYIEDYSSSPERWTLCATQDFSGS